MLDQQPAVCSRRGFLTTLGFAGIGLAAAACAPSAPSPTAAPPPPKPAATTAPAPPPAATAAPAPKPAATQAPAKPTFSKATIKLATIGTLLQGSIWLVGKKKGFFEEFGIDFQVVGAKDGNTVTNAILANEADLADAGIGTPLAAIEKGAAMKLLGTARPGLDAAVYSQKNINSLKDLEGKSVGAAAPGSFLALLMVALFEQAGVDKDKVEFVNIGASPAVYQAVVAGKVAAGPSLVEYLPTAERDGVKVLVEIWKALPNYVNWSIYATDKAIKEKGDEIARTMAGYAKSHRYVLQPESKAEFVKEAVDEFKAEPAQAEFAWKFYNDAKMINPNLDLTPQQVEYMQQLNLKAGTQTKVLPFDQVTDTSLQKKAISLLK